MARQQDKAFASGVRVTFDGSVTVVETVQQALLLLSSVDWPGKRGLVHEEAIETALKVLDGHRSAIDARDRFVEAARQAGILLI